MQHDACDQNGQKMTFGTELDVTPEDVVSCAVRKSLINKNLREKTSKDTVVTPLQELSKHMILRE